MAGDPILDDPENIRNLLFRLKQAELHPKKRTADEHAAVLREARLVIEGFSQRQNERTDR
jgi:hypothetical protein